MLTIEETRKYLPKECKNLSDEQVRKLRDETHGLAELILDIYFDQENYEK